MHFLQSKFSYFDTNSINDFDYVWQVRRQYSKWRWNVVTSAINSLGFGVKMNTSVNWVTIGLCTGSLSVWCQARPMLTYCEWSPHRTKTLGKLCPTENLLQNITVTSQWVRWRLKSPASRLLTEAFIQAQIKENIKAPRHWPLCGDSPENVSIWWRHHEYLWNCYVV